MTKIKEKLCPITKKFVNIQVDTEEVKISLLNTWMDNGEQNCHDIIDSVRLSFTNYNRFFKVLLFIYADAVICRTSKYLTH